MALRGKRKRKKAKRVATPNARNTNEGNGGSGRGITDTKTKRKNTQNPGTKQTANNAERGGGSDNHKKERAKNSVSTMAHRKHF